MKVTLKNTGSTAKFVSWVKSFADINKSLIIEVDLAEQMFVAKGFPSTKCVVKYSKISFDEAGYELRTILDNNDQAFDWKDYDKAASTRIKVGVYTILDKLEKTFTMFSETEHEMTINFDLCKNVMYIQTDDKLKVATPEYQAEQIILKAKSLTMVVQCSMLSEFFENCDDDKFFNRICKIQSPSTFSVSKDAMANFLKISSVFAKDPMTDKIKVYSKKDDDALALYVYDETSGTYDYLIGYYESGEQTASSIILFKCNFIMAIKSMLDDDLKITLDTAGASRMLVDNNMSKVIIGAAKIAHK